MCLPAYLLGAVELLRRDELVAVHPEARVHSGHAHELQAHALSRPKVIQGLACNGGGGEADRGMGGRTRGNVEQGTWQCSCSLQLAASLQDSP